MVTAVGPPEEARSLAFPANDSETVLAPDVWLTVAIMHVAEPLEFVVPLHVCAVPPLPRVNAIETPTTALPPVVWVSTADKLAALPSVNVVPPVYVSVVAAAGAAAMVTATGPEVDG